MRHLLLYEAFKAKGISKTLKYLSDNDIAKENFLEDLKHLLNNYDLPISDIDDNDIHYMSKKKAEVVKLPDDYEIMNPYGVYTVKFWFSVSEGYLGSSVLKGDLKGDLKNDEIDELKKEYPEITNYVKINSRNLKNLKEGDKIVARFRYSDNPYTKGTIFVEDGEFYAVTNNTSYDGGRPYSNKWKKYGEFTWRIGSTRGVGSDTYDIKLISTKDEVILNSYKEGDIIKSADFCLVIYLDELVNHTPVIDKRVDRKEKRSGALALMSQDEIKKANYERYMMEILKGMGFEKDSKFDDLKNLQKIAQKVVVGDWALFSIWSNEPGISYIKNFSNKIRYKEINRIIHTYEDISKDYLNIKKRFIGSNQRVKNLANKDSKNIFNIYYDLSIKLNNKIKNSNLETLEDLILIHYKLDSLRSFLKSDVSISNGMVKLLDNFYYNDSDVDYGIELLNNEDDLEKDEKAYKLIDRFIEKLF